MNNYNKPVNAQTSKYAYGISKLLSLLVEAYSTSRLNELILQSHFRDPNSTIIDIHPVLLQQVSKGLLVSHKLIDTPLLDTKLLYKLERSLSRLVSFKLNDEYQLSCTVDNQPYWVFSYKDISHDQNELYVYSYFSRMGYTVEEEIGKYYYVKEPLGTEYRINNYSCSCPVGTQHKKCLHLFLIDFYKKAKAYENYKRTKFNL